MTTTASIAVFFHNYYGDHAGWVERLCRNIPLPFDLYYNVVENSIHNAGVTGAEILTEMNAAKSGNQLQKIYLRVSPNQGKDLGGKLVLLDSFMRSGQKIEWLLFLHDKQSPHKADPLTWKNRLYRILESDFIEKVMRLFEADESVSVVAAEGSVAQEYDSCTASYKSSSAVLIKEMVQAYQMIGHNTGYVAGTMFWARASAGSEFFKEYSPLSIRATLEKGNVMDDFDGTRTHAWERIISWVFSGQGWKIKELA
ncbi:MAG: rhamnan synthesis F family protein [Chitinophagaceae bacterium]